MCQRGFDEARMFSAVGDGGASLDVFATSELEQYLAYQRAKELKYEFQSRFRNISRIMDCVGCEKCRLWGKLQVLGLGTALKILMSDDEAGGFSLQRNEVIALLNTLGQLSTSVQVSEGGNNTGVRPHHPVHPIHPPTPPTAQPVNKDVACARDEEGAGLGWAEGCGSGQRSGLSRRTGAAQAGRR